MIDSYVYSTFGDLIVGCMMIGML